MTEEQLRARVAQLEEALGYCTCSCCARMAHALALDTSAWLAEREAQVRREALERAAVFIETAHGIFGQGREHLANAIRALAATPSETTPKPCGTCGGRGRLPRRVIGRRQEPGKPCPDCKAPR